LEKEKNKLTLSMSAIVILGAGNVATHLSRALQNAGFTILQVYSRTKASAQALSDKLGCAYCTEYDQIVRDAAFYIYALKDSVLDEAIEILKIPTAVHVHTAGSVSLTVFEGKVSRYGVIYPLQTLSKNKNIDFREVPLFVEGCNAEVTALLLEMAGCISQHCRQIDSRQRAALHLAAVFCCNFVNCMYAVADEVVTQADLPFDVLLPLISETAGKISSLSPAEAQTGPAVRYDTNIMNKHLDMLADKPQLQEIYQKMSDLIFEMCRKA
jgi:predicted short-subunit dehydrogenase-like oxidoreductase (DUF2520 family)